MKNILGIGLVDNQPTMLTLTSAQQGSYTVVIGIENYQLYGQNSSGEVVALKLNSLNGLLS